MTLRVGVIGLGVGEQHVRAFSDDPGTAVVAVCDLDPERLGRAQELRPGLRTTTDAAELIADPELDVVSIASYDDAHFEQVRAALLAGKHVFAEKPLCTSAEQLRELRAALDENPSLQLASNLVLRSAPLYRWMREAREGGELGRVYAFDGDYLYGRLHKITDGWRGEVPDYHGDRRGKPDLHGRHRVPLPRLRRRELRVPLGAGRARHRELRLGAAAPARGAAVRDRGMRAARRSGAAAAEQGPA